MSRNSRRVGKPRETRKAERAEGLKDVIKVSLVPGEGRLVRLAVSPVEFAYCDVQQLACQRQARLATAVGQHEHQAGRGQSKDGGSSCVGVWADPRVVMEISAEKFTTHSPIRSTTHADFGAPMTVVE